MQDCRVDSIQGKFAEARIPGSSNLSAGRLHPAGDKLPSGEHSPAEVLIHHGRSFLFGFYRPTEAISTSSQSESWSNRDLHAIHPLISESG